MVYLGDKCGFFISFSLYGSPFKIMVLLFSFDSIWVLQEATDTLTFCFLEYLEEIMKQEDPGRVT